MRTPNAIMAWLWTLAILVVCWLPRMYLGVNEKVGQPFFVPNIDKLVHLGIFAIFAFLWMRVGSRADKARNVLIAGVALAIVTEVGQENSFVRRDASVGDALADIAGVVVGVAGYRLVSGRRARGPVETRA